MTKPINIAVDDDFSRYSLGVLSRLSGLVLKSGSPADVLVGERTASSQLLIPRVDGYTSQDIPGIPTDADYEAVLKPGCPFPFDIFRGLRFWLADEGNAHVTSAERDAHDRLRRKSSVQAEKSDHPVPIVNAYGLLFRRWLEAQLGITAQPNRCRIALTHDVDDPVNPSDLSQAFWVMGAAMFAGRPRATLGQLRGLHRVLRARLKPTMNQNWNFEDIVRLEANYGCRSAFYFAATPWWMKGASERDVTYDIRSPKFRRLFKVLRSSGAEVGLHMSYNAYRDLTLLQEEKRRLEKSSGGPVLGGRHHYWHLRFPMWSTLNSHGNAGLVYDTSVGFNECPGYRLGIGQTFYPWNPLTQSSMSTLQIPTLIMDGALLYDEAMTVDAALENINSLLDTLKRYEGTAAIDWHVRTSYPGRPDLRRWAQVYEGLLERLASDSGIDVLTPHQILDDSN